MAATLIGTAPPAMPTRAEATASRFTRAAAALRDTGDPDLVGMAQVFERWLASGGDLAAALGARARRGCSQDLPAHAGRERAKRQAVRQAVQFLGLETETPLTAAKVLAAMLARPIGAHILRGVAVDVELPRSEAQLIRIIRCTES